MGPVNSSCWVAGTIESLGGSHQPAPQLSRLCLLAFAAGAAGGGRGAREDMLLAG